jgi:hypothetical protein
LTFLFQPNSTSISLTQPSLSFSSSSRNHSFSIPRSNPSLPPFSHESVRYITVSHKLATLFLPFE